MFNTSNSNDGDTMDMGIDMSSFGQLETNEVKMSPKGLAIKFVTRDNKVKYRAWDQKRNRMTDVSGMTLEMSGMIFMMPTQRLTMGDIVKHDGEFCFIKEVARDGSFTVINGAGAMEERLETKNLFGFNFYSKVVSPMKSFGGDSSNGIGGLMKMHMMMGMFGGQQGMGGQQGGLGGLMQMQMMMSMFGGKDANPFSEMMDFDSMFSMCDAVGDLTDVPVTDEPEFSKEELAEALDLLKQAKATKTKTSDTPE